MIPLDELKQGENAVIDKITTDKLPLKLIEMGCLPGNPISLIQKDLTDLVEHLNNNKNKIIKIFN